MSMTDPIADLLTRIRNAQSAGKATVGVGASKLKLAILKVLKDEGYIGDFGVDAASAGRSLSIELKYHDGRPVIDRIERISRPGLRIYRGKDELPKVGVGWTGRRRGLDPEGHHVGPAGARGRHRRRSALRRSIAVRNAPCLELQRSR
jgi:small subunit ribosomal protein S8